VRTPLKRLELDQTAKLTASGAAASDQFGYSDDRDADGTDNGRPEDGAGRVDLTRAENRVR
jgi:hypothetical protein